MIIFRLLVFIFLFLLSWVALAQKHLEEPVIKIGGGFIEPLFSPSMIVPMTEKDETAEKIKSFALKYFKEHKSTISIKGRVFPTDCSNFVRAVYFAALNMDFFEEAEKEEVIEPGNNSGVETIYNLFEAKYKIKEKPDVGDLIFFDNSYDKNRNRKWDDEFTHTAVIIEIQPDDTIVFIHGGTGRGIAKDYMNLKYPHEHMRNGKIENSYLQRTYKWMKSSPKLTAELFHAFGGIE